MHEIVLSWAPLKAGLEEEAAVKTGREQWGNRKAPTLDGESVLSHLLEESSRA